MNEDKIGFGDAFDKSFVGNILGGKNLEESLESIERIASWVGSMIKHHLFEKERGIEFETQIFGWIFSLSDYDFEYIFSQTLGDGKNAGSYKTILDFLRSLGSGGNEDSYKLIPIGSSPFISGVSFSFRDGKITHITPDQFSLFSEFWKKFHDYSYDYFHLNSGKDVPDDVQKISVSEKQQELIRKIIDHMSEKNHEVSFYFSNGEFLNCMPKGNTIQEIYKNLDGDYVLVIDNQSTITIPFSFMKGLTYKYYSENRNSNTNASLTSNIKEWWAKLNGL